MQMKKLPITKKELKVGMKVYGIDRRTHNIDFVGTVIYIDNESTSIKREDKRQGLGKLLDGYGTTWNMTYTHSKVAWTDANNYLSKCQTNWREKLSK